MDRCKALRGAHNYVENGPRMATVPDVQAAQCEREPNMANKILWTVEKICTACHKTAVFDQDGAELPNEL